MEKEKLKLKVLKRLDQEMLKCCYAVKIYYYLYFRVKLIYILLNIQFYWWARNFSHRNGADVLCGYGHEIIPLIIGSWFDQSSASPINR